MTPTIRAWCKQALTLASRSRCTRDKVGALLIDPRRKVVVCEGYNGTIRGGPHLCGGEVCDRDDQMVKSGTCCEIGCVHAEANLLANCNTLGVSMAGRWVVVTREPCGSCQKLLDSVEVERVIVTGEYV